MQLNNDERDPIGGARHVSAQGRGSCASRGRRDRPRLPACGHRRQLPTTRTRWARGRGRGGASRPGAGRRPSCPAAITATTRRLRRSSGRRTALGVDYIDLYLIHWPNPSVGQVRRHLARDDRLATAGWSGRSGSRTSPGLPQPGLIDETGVTPAVNQIELHPCFPQAGCAASMRANGIVTEAWSPLGRAHGVRSRRTRHRGGRGRLTA